VFLAVNALFVGAEFAIIGVSRTAIESRSGKGDGLARRVLAVLTSSDDQDRFIATAQFGITVASLGLGMYAEHAVAAWLEPRLQLPAIARLITAHSLASILAVSALTYVHILFGETIPKAIALAAAERTAKVLYWPMRAVMLVFYPFVWILNGTGNAVLRLLRIPQQAESSHQVYSPEELKIIVEESADGGALRAESGWLLHELLTFGDLTAAETMVPRVRVVGIPIGATPETVRNVLRAHHHARYPIYDGDLDHIAGMMHVKDLLKRLLANEPIAAGDAKPLPMLPVSSKLDAVLETMQRTQAHLAVVIDEHGGTAGVISLEDLFEEVVGEIDEGDAGVPPISRTGDGAVLVAGTVRLDELGRQFDLDLSHEEVDSVSGLILALLGRPPVVGDSVVYDRVRLDVTGTTGRGVRQARATLLPDDMN